MMSLATINELSRKAAHRAAREHRLPLVVEAEDDAATVIRSIPNFGDYRPKGWAIVPRADLVEPESFRPGRLRYLACDDDFVFVDSSGFGEPGEPALTQSEFLALVESNPGTGWAIVEAGQFQVVIGAFKRSARKVAP